jgi:hypothetical protein
MRKMRNFEVGYACFCWFWWFLLFFSPGDYELDPESGIVRSFFFVFLID